MQWLADAVSSNFIRMKINREHSSGSLLYKPNTAWAHIQTVSTYLPTLALSHTCVTYRTHCEGSMIANRQTSCLDHYCTSENYIVFGKFLVSILIISYKNHFSAQQRKHLQLNWQCLLCQMRLFLLSTIRHSEVSVSVKRMI